MRNQDEVYLGLGPLQSPACCRRRVAVAKCCGENDHDAAPQD